MLGRLCVMYYILMYTEAIEVIGRGTKRRERDANSTYYNKKYCLNVHKIRRKGAFFMKVFVHLQCL